MHRFIARVSGTKGLVSSREDVIVLDDITKAIEQWTHHIADVEVQGRAQGDASLKMEQTRLTRNAPAWPFLKIPSSSFSPSCPP